MMFKRKQKEVELRLLFECVWIEMKEGLLGRQRHRAVLSNCNLPVQLPVWKVMDDEQKKIELWHSLFTLFFKKIYLFEKQSYRETERESIHPLVHSLDACNSQEPMSTHNLRPWSHPWAPLTCLSGCHLGLSLGHQRGTANLMCLRHKSWF